MRRMMMAALVVLMACTTAEAKKKVKSVELWPDGTEIPAWFSDTSRVDLSGLKHYVVTDYGVERWRGRHSERYVPERFAILQA